MRVAGFWASGVNCSIGIWYPGLWGPKGRPQGPKGGPQGPKLGPQGPKGCPQSRKGGPQGPKGPDKGPRGVHRGPRGAHKGPRAAHKGFRGGSMSEVGGGVVDLIWEIGFGSVAARCVAKAVRRDAMRCEGCVHVKRGELLLMVFPMGSDCGVECCGVPWTVHPWVAYV